MSQTQNDKKKRLKKRHKVVSQGNQMIKACAQRCGTEREQNI